MVCQGIGMCPKGELPGRAYIDSKVYQNSDFWALVPKLGTSAKYHLYVQILSHGARFQD